VCVEVKVGPQFDGIFSGLTPELGTGEGPDLVSAAAAAELQEAKTVRLTGLERTMTVSRASSRAD
jgi:hypothetical protein